MFNVLYSSTFMGANQNPLDPTNWTTVSTNPLQILNAECTSAGTGGAAGNGAAYYSGGQNLTSDQGVQFTVPTFVQGEIELYLRYNSSGGTGYKLLINVTGQQVLLFNPSGSQIGSDGLITTPGDVYFFSCVGTTITVQHNGTTIIQVSDATSDLNGTANLTFAFGGGNGNIGITTFSLGSVTSGFSISGNTGVGNAVVNYSGTSSGSVTANGSGAYSITGLANGNYTLTPQLSGFVFTPPSQNVTISGSNITGVNFTASAVGAYYSQPDCRLTPNASRDVNQTLIYDVQTSSNPSVPGTDSRGAKPVDSSQSPQNSRTPGTYGPGE
jgi:hypothetical protein